MTLRARLFFAILVVALLSLALALAIGALLTRRAVERNTLKDVTAQLDLLVEREKDALLPFSPSTLRALRPFLERQDERPSDMGEEIVDADPTVAKPLVYHLFGHISDPDSVVLTEDDHFAWLIAWIARRKDIPPAVRKAMISKSLLFLGYDGVVDPNPYLVGPERPPGVQTDRALRQGACRLQDAVQSQRGAWCRCVGWFGHETASSETLWTRVEITGGFSVVYGSNRTTFVSLRASSEV